MLVNTYTHTSHPNSSASADLFYSTLKDFLRPCRKGVHALPHAAMQPIERWVVIQINLKVIDSAAQKGNI